MTRLSYSHPGWTGKPYESDFEAKWGPVQLAEILDCRECKTNLEAVQKAKTLGKVYILAPKKSKSGNFLYKIEGRNARCIDAILNYQRENAASMKNAYQTDAAFRVTQIFRAAKSRAKALGVTFELDLDDVLRRVLENGRCEVTGVPFDMSPGSATKRGALAPSLDQIQPRGGYTPGNTQIVCWAYNLMRSNFDQPELERFIKALKRRG
jgi:hypothetical protein